MNHVQQLTERVETDGILGISGAVFKPLQQRNFVTGEMYTRYPNHTVESYCEEMGKHCGTSAENYAAELLAMMDAKDIIPTKFNDSQGLKL